MNIMYCRSSQKYPKIVGCILFLRGHFKSDQQNGWVYRMIYRCFFNIALVDRKTGFLEPSSKTKSQPTSYSLGKFEKPTSEGVNKSRTSSQKSLTSSESKGLVPLTNDYKSLLKRWSFPKDHWIYGFPGLPGRWYEGCSPSKWPISRDY